MDTDLLKEDNDSKDIFTGEDFIKEYELYQSYTRFNVYKVYKVYPKTKKRVFLYTETKERTDYGKRLYTKQELLNELNKRLEVIDDANKSIRSKSEYPEGRK